MNTKRLAIKGDQNKFSVLLDGDTFGPKILFFGDEIRFLVPDSSRLTQMATVGKWFWGEAETISMRLNMAEKTHYKYVPLPEGKHK